MNLHQKEKLDPQQSFLPAIEMPSYNQNYGTKVYPPDSLIPERISRVNRGTKRSILSPILGENETQSAQCDEEKNRMGSRSSSTGSLSLERHMTLEMVEEVGTEQGATETTVVSLSSSSPSPISSLKSSGLLLSKFQHLKRSWDTSCDLLANSETIDWSRVYEALYPGQHCLSLLLPFFHLFSQRREQTNDFCISSVQS